MEQGNAATKKQILNDLRKKVSRLEGFRETAPTGKLQFSIPQIDQALGGTLPPATTHEFVCLTSHDMAATLGLIIALIAAADKQGYVIWIMQRADICSAALSIFNFAPERLLIIEARRDRETLWAAEEALRTPGLSGVIAEIGQADLTATRRLQLAAEQGGVTGFLLRTRAITASSCVTRWSVTPALSVDDGLPGIGLTHWQVRLERMRGGKPGAWNVTWQAGKFTLVRPSNTQAQQTPLRQLA